MKYFLMMFLGMSALVGSAWGLPYNSMPGIYHGRDSYDSPREYDSPRAYDSSRLYDSPRSYDSPRAYDSPSMYDRYYGYERDYQPSGSRYFDTNGIWMGNSFDYDMKDKPKRY